MSFYVLFIQIDISRNLDGVGGEIIHTGNPSETIAKKSQISLTSTAEITHSKNYSIRMEESRK